ncbi:BFH_collapsed_G0021030.mRNA.1.CDS.1 [Saccharomyces cerevisiae]|nr:BFH_collapsed_G0021030.mRNA.1.CDS.1 [Saccharomyces cerevisiae]
MTSHQTKTTALSCNRLIYSENKSVSWGSNQIGQCAEKNNERRRSSDDQKKFKLHELTTEEEVLEEYEWDDLDEEDCDDPLMVSEEVNDILEYTYKDVHLEIITLPNKANLYKHKNIKQNRDILVNWIIKIQSRLGPSEDDTEVPTRIKNTATQDGTTCLFIASKYEEIYSPSIKQSDEDAEKTAHAKWKMIKEVVER